MSINKGSYRCSKEGFKRLLNTWKVKYEVKGDSSKGESLYEVITEKGILKVQYKPNGWLTIT